MAVAIAAASIARGTVHYLAVLFPFSTPILTLALVAGFTGIAALGVRESVGLAAAMGVVEIAGLVVAIAAGLLAAPEFHMAGMFPMDLAGWRGAFAGAFIAFFAFIGFETLANLAEEVKDPKQTVPRGILGAVGQVLFYMSRSRPLRYSRTAPPAALCSICLRARMPRFSRQSAALRSPMEYWWRS